MLKKLKLKNFRNFTDGEFFFSTKTNAIIGENGKGKTNILEAIALIHGGNISKINFDNLVKNPENVFYIEIETICHDKISISYDKKDKRKRYSYNNKNITLKKLSHIINKVVFFSPIVMNIMYLSPNLRRNFLDEILSSSFEEYKNIMSEYKKILISRNKVLKNIRENKSSKSEIEFWNKSFSIKASQLYNYRFGIVNFLEKNTYDFTNYFENKIIKFEFEYKTKILENKKNNKGEKLKDIQKQIIKYLDNNLDRDIILGVTNIGPHTDDFDILVDNVSLKEFASRGEVKSVIIGLKLLEIKFIEKYRDKKPILLIDDLLSELDKKHKNLLLENIKGYQVFISSIKNDYEKDVNIISL